jgi:hypothetical protein
VLYGVTGDKTVLKDFWHWSALEDPNHRSRNLRMALELVRAHVERRQGLR